MKARLSVYSIICVFVFTLATSHEVAGQGKAEDRLIGNWKCFEIVTENCDDPDLNKVEACAANAGLIFYPDGTMLMYEGDKEDMKGTYKVRGNSIILNDDQSQNLTFYIEEDIFSFVDPDNDSCYETQRFKKVK